MNKWIFLAIVVVIIVVGVLWRVAVHAPSTEKIAIPITMPWVEVESPGVRALGQEERVLETGDVLSVGDEITTDATGVATIYFPDGSRAHINANTTLALTQASYNSADGTLVARLFLKAGTVWSKIIGLATPSSVWEVTTDTTVAAVRGTAFGVERTKTQSRIIGFENTVSVFARDKVAKKLLDVAPATVASGTVFEIADTDVSAIAQKKVSLAKHLISTQPNTLSQPWVSRSIKKDEGVRTRMQELTDKGKDIKEIRATIRQDVINQFKDRIESRRASRSGDTSGALNLLENRVGHSSTTPSVTPRPSVLPSPVISPKPQGILPVELSIVLRTTNAKLVFKEGEKILCEAWFTMSDGSKKRAEKVAWKVVGGIGTIDSTGLLTTALSENVAEYGFAVGSVTASVGSALSDKILFAKTPIITVQTSVEPVLNGEG
ncbi:MAG: FecR domain-containing protein [Candidatus Pacebacteria bacterium]|nr:FecR domain-containing protein [Candidatus Paceibacterota bacterium]